MDARALDAELEPAEYQFLRLTVGGHSLARAASLMSIPFEEAAILKADLMKKVGATTTADLVRIGIYAEI